MLDRVTIAAPCPADWDSMPGTDRVRRCSECNKNVYNLSAMTRREAETLLRETQGRLCTRLYRRADGTILTENCPAGLRAIGRRVSRFAGAAMSAVAALSSATAAQFPIFPVPSALLEARSSVNGFVKDVRGVGIENAEVAVSRTGPALKRVTSTDSAGRFQVESLPMGSYTVRIQVPGFRVYTSEIILTPVRAHNLTATMLVGSVGGAVVVDYAK